MRKREKKKEVQNARINQQTYQVIKIDIEMCIPYLFRMRNISG